VINWEMRGRKPSEQSREKLTEAVRRVFGREFWVSEWDFWS